MSARRRRRALPQAGKKFYSVLRRYVGGDGAGAELDANIWRWVAMRPMSGRRSALPWLLLVGLFVQSRQAARRREAGAASNCAARSGRSGPRRSADAAATRGRAGGPGAAKAADTGHRVGRSMRLRKQQRLALVVLALAAGRRRHRPRPGRAQRQGRVLRHADAIVAKRSTSRPASFRLGGLVVDGSIQRQADGSVRFAVTDKAQQVEVTYKGLLPDLFRDGQGVVTQGVLRADGMFQARRGAGQARRELHAQGSGRRAEAGGLLERAARVGGPKTP